MITIVDLFERSVEKYSANPYLWEKTGSEFVPKTYKQVKGEVYCLANGLLSMGVKNNETIALLSEGRNWWVVSELAILYTGAINVPLSIKLESPDLHFRLEHSDTSIIFVSGNQAGKINAIKGKLPKLKHIIYLDEQDEYAENEMHISKVMEQGESFMQNNPDALSEATKRIGLDHYATISYTSGTTADPKGVILSHRNYTANVEQALTLMNIPQWYRTLIILPLDHCFAHVAGLYSFMAMGASIGTVQVGKTSIETLKNIPTNIKEFKPNLLLSVPALAKTFKKSIESNIKAKGKTVEMLFNFAMKISYRYNKEGYNKGAGLTFLYKPLIWLFRKILIDKVREGFGGELDFFIGGGALLDIELQRFFYAVGMPMMQGYGLSEATPIISSNSLERHKLGSSGYLVTPMELKICDDNGVELPVGQKGEIVIKGENVMVGYWKNEKATAETVKDGWLYTGDMGYMDKDGFLYVLGRFKSLLIGNDGEKYSPEGIEETVVQQSPLIDQFVLYNNQNAYTTALVVPAKEMLKKATQESVADLSSHEAVNEAIKLLQNDIAQFKTGGELAGQFPDRWLPVTFAVIGEPFSEKNGLVNSTMKLVRGKVEKRYADKIDFLYTPEGKDVFNSINVTAIKELFEK
ncbi:MAG TPA: AMP-binding protein [Perlabentimonas sp.]|nr:AMP-binding protein [Bacteroidales bacterium]MDD4672162.1 AMP-binding protein [Bacteroidales bacterium]HZJ74646.1 AMP-binding protein [Perlabentimonas sp.]